MALKGNLRDFSFTQLLNLVHLARKNGALILEKGDESARVSFCEGKLSFAQLGSGDNSLAMILRLSGKISQNQYRILGEKAGDINDKELGLLLINAGYLSQNEILMALQFHYLSIVKTLFDWKEGVFRFDQTERLSEGKIPIRIDLENLIIESSRQMKEADALQEEIPSLDIGLRLKQNPGNNLRNLNLSQEEWRVLSFIKPDHTIKQIALQLKMSDFAIRKVVYSLLQAGLVDMARVGASTFSIASRVFPNSDRSQQKSIVNRLIQKIRSI